MRLAHIRIHCAPVIQLLLGITVHKSGVGPEGIPSCGWDHHKVWYLELHVYPLYFRWRTR